MPHKRRRFIQSVGATGAIGMAGCLGGGGGGGNKPSEVVIGDLHPLSGPFARDGKLCLQGTKFAVQEINNNGGIKALDGAKFKVVSEDTGESTGSATSAAQDLYSSHNPTATIGSWLSSQTLATTSVSEREGVPQLTLSYSDKIVQRGYNYVFKTAPLSSAFGKASLNLSVQLANAVGSNVNKVALVGDNTAAITFTFDPLRKKFIPRKKGVKLVVDQVWTPTLSDATPIVRRLKEEEPDVMFFGATAFADALAILRKMNELNVQVPTIGIGAWLTLPAYVNNIGADLIKNIMAVTGGHPLKGQAEQVKKFTDFAKEPFVIQDSILSYAHVYLIKAAIEQSGSTKPKKVRDALAKMNLSKGPGVTSLPVTTVNFKDNGQMANAQPVLTQWQDRGNASYIGTPAAPFTVFPEKYAMRKVNWVPAKYE